MRDLALQIAAGLAVFIGLIHSILGERYILTRLFRRELPKLFGDDWFTRRTLRFAWHITTLAWWGFAALLLLAAGEGGLTTPEALWVIALTFGVSALIAFFASSGRHLAWIVFLAIALLAGAVARGDEAHDEAPQIDRQPVATAES